MSDEKHPEMSWGGYYVVYNVLLLLTILTFAFSYVHLGPHAVNIAVALVIAAVQGSLGLFFMMGMRHEDRLSKGVFLFCACLFTIAVMVTLTDFVFLGTYSVSHQVAQVMHGLADAAVGQ